MNGEKAAGEKAAEAYRLEYLRFLTSEWAGRNFLYISETDSTNEEAKRLAEQGAPHGTLIAAGRQTGGKGRRGRAWESPDDGNSIYMTLLLKPDFAPGHASRLTLLAALAVTRAIEELSGAQVLIKWPNDIVIGGRKVCGILTELCAQDGAIRHVEIGIGINVSQTQFPQEISHIAGSVLGQTGQRLSRAQIMAGVMSFFEQYYERYIQTYDLSAVRINYEEHLANKDREVRVLDPKGEYDGIARGISDGGELIVERADGTREAVYAGEVSVRGLYGYV